MQLLAALAILTSAAAANEWTLYCGSACSDGTVIASGKDWEDAPCTNFDDGTTYDHCYIESDEPYWKAVVYSRDSCRSAGEAGDLQSMFPGECSDKGAWKSYQVVLNL